MSTALMVVGGIFLLVILYYYGGEIACFIPSYSSAKAIPFLGDFVNAKDVWNTCDYLVP